MTSVTVWNEFVHEQNHDEVAEIYPDGIHTAIATALESAGFETQTATLHESEHGLTETVLEDTDVLIWWGHAAHDEVNDKIVNRVQRYVLNGMGLIVLHSAHASKIFRALMGTSCGLKWREAAEMERLWITNPAHPIVNGVDNPIQVPEAEMYGEHFDIPEPDSLVFTSWFEGGEVLRSGCCYYRGEGRVFYFRPGHETYPIYHQEEIQKVIANACEWASRNSDGPEIIRGNHDPLEDLNTPDDRSVH